MDYYHSRRHKEWRAKVLRRDKYLCQDCKAYGKHIPATTAHHIKERDQYPELQHRLDNGVALCMACHNKRHPEKGAAPKR